jgi:hypothetical protein
LSPYNRDITLPCTIKFAVELNVPIPDEVGVNVAFHIILLPAVIVGEAVLLANVDHVIPLSIE